jgi:hypothetical protein
MEPGARINLLLDSDQVENIQINSNGSYIASFEEPILGIEVPWSSAKKNN